MSGSGRRLRIVQVISGMHIGGAENVVKILAGTLDRERFESGLCCTRQLGVLADRLREEAPDVDIMLAKPPRSVLRYLAPLSLKRQLSRFRPDVVHSHGRAAMLHMGPLAMLGWLPPWVHTFHFGNYDASGGGRAVAAEAFFSRFATRLVAVSEHQRTSIIRRHGVTADRITTIVNGVASRSCQADRESALRKRAELGIAPGEVAVGAIAVLSEQKGLTFLLKAARQLVDRGCPARFFIVGGGPLESALRDEAQALGLDSRVVFTGWRPDGPELMPAFDIFVMSSLWEAMPMALLEAMAARRAIVVTDVGDNRRIVDDGRCGEVVPPREVDPLADAIDRLVSQPARRRALGETASERHRAHYTVDRMTSSYERLYISLAS